MIWIAVTIILIYVSLILLFLLGGSLVKRYTSLSSPAQTHFSVIIPFRNEEAHLPYLLTSLSKLNYPSSHYEILLVNDESDDKSLVIANTFVKKHIEIPITILQNNRLSPSPKKDAIQTAIHHAEGKWIVTTDADCTVLPEWLTTLDHFITSTSPKMVVMPVAIASGRDLSFLEAYQQLDFLSLMGATVGGFGLGFPFLSNGANLAFTKQAFIDLGGYSSHQHIASGDDHFLLEKITGTYQNSVKYLKSSKVIVTTQPQPSWYNFIQQRVRWAAKGTAYTFWFSKVVGVLVLVTNVFCSFLICIVLAYLLSGCMGYEYAFAKAYTTQLPITLLLVKVLADAWLILQQGIFYNQKKYFLWYPIVAVCYPLVTCYIAVRALKGGFKWKGRDYTR